MNRILTRSLISACFLLGSVHISHAAEIRPVFRNLFVDHMATPIDIDADGDLDLVFGVFTDFTAGANSTAVFHNDGSGQFSGPHVIDYKGSHIGDTTLFGTRISGEAPALHRQLKTTISSAVSHSEMLRIPFSNSSSLTQQYSSETLGDNIYCKNGGTIDSDSFLDYLISKVGNISISWGNNGGELQLVTQDDSNEFERLLAMIDIDGNGHKDILYKGSIDDNYGTCIIYQTSSRVFGATSLLKTTGDSPISNDTWKLADIDGNGMPDLYYSDGKTLHYHLKTAAGFSPLAQVNHTHDLGNFIGIIEKTGATADYIYLHIDDQGNSEVHKIIFQTPASPIVSQRLNDLLPDGDTITTRQYGNSRTIHDINADGIKDIILSLPVSDSWENTSNAQGMNRLCIGIGQLDGSFSFSWQGSAPLSSHSYSKGSFLQMGKTDLIVGASLNRELMLLNFTNENGWERNRMLTELLPNNYKTAGVSIDRIHPVDLNSDGISDLVVRYRRSTSGSPVAFTYYCGVAMNNGAGTFTIPDALPADFLNGLIDHDCLIFDFADWDGDGDLDAMAHGYGWYENTGSKFSANLQFLAGGATAVDALGNPIMIAESGIVRDIDGDGAMDLFIPAVGHHAGPYTPNPSSTQAMIIYGNGSGEIGQITYHPISLIASDAFGNPITLGYTIKDMNLDGKEDLIFSIPLTDALGNPIARYHIAYNSSDGRFQTFQSINVATAIKGIQEGDYNGDGVIDLCRIDGYSSPSPSGIVVSPNYHHFTSLGINNFLEMIDIDNDHDGDFLFTPRSINEGLFVGVNPIVNGSDPVVRYALDAGLFAADTLPLADPENDHITNLEEYMFGGNPAVADGSNILPHLGVDTSVSPPRLTASFKRRKSLPSGRQYFIHLSQDLSSWVDYPLDSATGTSIDETWEQLNLSIDMLDYFSGAQKGFVDWSVE